MHKPNESDDLPFLDEPETPPTRPETGAPTGGGQGSPQQRPAPPSEPAQQAGPAGGDTPPARKAGPAGSDTPPPQQPITPTPEPEVAAAAATPEPEPEPEPAAAPEPVRRGKSRVIPPAVLASRMQRYSIYLIILAFIIVGANYQALTLSSILWFAAGVTAGFALLCAIAVVLLNAIAWNFDRLARELRGDLKAVDLSGK